MTATLQAPAAAWFAPREPGASRGPLSRRVAKVVGHLAKRDRRTMEAEVAKVQALSERLAALDDAALLPHLAQVRLAYRQARGSRVAGAPELTNALAAVAAAARRTTGLTPSFPQLLAALAMADNYAVQLAPGEGKTLAVAMAAVLGGWDGRPCHVVTANEYLAARDVELMRKLYTLCGCSASAVTRKWTASWWVRPTPATSFMRRRRSCWPTSCATSCSCAVRRRRCSAASGACAAAGRAARSR
ncbi:hypothetical protein HK414_15715 [Ramlibacter terrae]|uniref:SecA family profile domain-containing protein n=1 Tax=Ramlibacter terrae TaxID=2732511 RepID=A0ABX6P641_9BURK|nr:hypothetical protein HK414_15715 [Ramlibacter terrae]